MASGGQYDRHARVQASASAFALDIVRRAADEAALSPPSEPIALADYGSATGKNSLAPVAVAVEALRARDSRSILVFHVDQPENDFSTLFSTLRSEPQSYSLGAPSVFGCAVGRSFYEPVLPTGAVSVGWSSAAAHWLSRTPAALTEHLWAPTARSPGAAPFAEQARQDWHSFVRLRADELRPGGQMVVVVATVDEHGVCGGEHVLDGLDHAARRLVSAGALSHEEYGRMVVPNFFLSRPELEGPFAHPELRGRLELIEHVRVIVPDPLWASFETTGNGAAFGAAFVGWLRAFSESCLFGALGPGRSADERRRLADHAYGELGDEIRRQPEAARCAWRMAALRFRKR